jgi:hypothetical protein
MSDTPKTDEEEPNPLGEQEEDYDEGGEDTPIGDWV